MNRVLACTHVLRHAARFGNSTPNATLGAFVSQRDDLGPGANLSLLRSNHRSRACRRRLQLWVDSRQLSGGLQFIWPWQRVRIANVQVQRHQFKLDTFSKESQDVFITATLNYQISASAVQQLYRTVGPRYFERLVEGRVNQQFKDETVKYASVDIAPHREAIRKAVRDRLTRELQPFSIGVVDLLIDNIDFSEAFKRSIEEKQIATQQALRAEQIVEQRRFEAQQEIEKAKGEAEATRLRANGQAEANRLLAESLMPEVIQFQALQKLADNVQLALLPSGQGIIIDPATLLARR